MTNCASRTRIHCFEVTHTWTIENWKNWLQITHPKPNKNGTGSSALYSEKFILPFMDGNGVNQTTTWQLKAFPEKDLQGRTRLKIKLVSYNGHAVVPSGTYTIKSEPLFSFHNLSWFGFHWDDRNLDRNLKAQFPVPHRWPKKNLEIAVTVKLLVPVNVSEDSISVNNNTVCDPKIQAALCDNINKALKLSSIAQKSNSFIIGGSKKNGGRQTLSTTKRVINDFSKWTDNQKVNRSTAESKNNNKNKCNRRDSNSSENQFPTAPSLMEPF